MSHVTNTNKSNDNFLNILYWTNNNNRKCFVESPCDFWLVLKMSNSQSPCLYPHTRSLPSLDYCSVSLTMDIIYDYDYSYFKPVAELVIDSRIVTPWKSPLIQCISKNWLWMKSMNRHNKKIVLFSLVEQRVRLWTILFWRNHRESESDWLTDWLWVWLTNWMRKWFNTKNEEYIFILFDLWIWIWVEQIIQITNDNKTPRERIPADYMMDIDLRFVFVIKLFVGRMIIRGLSQRAVLGETRLRNNKFGLSWVSTSISASFFVS